MIALLLKCALCLKLNFPAPKIDPVGRYAPGETTRCMYGFQMKSFEQMNFVWALRLTIISLLQHDVLDLIVLCVVNAIAFCRVPKKNSVKNWSFCSTCSVRNWIPNGQMMTTTVNEIDTRKIFLRHVTYPQAIRKQASSEIFARKSANGGRFSGGKSVRGYRRFEFRQRK